MAKKSFPKTAGWRAVVLGAILLVALGVGLITVFKAGAEHQRRAAVWPLPATGAQLEASRQAIAAQYLELSEAERCADNGQAYSNETFYKYLRVNAYNNRAVVRACTGSDVLLARIDGAWQKTDVALDLDQSVRSSWQQKCMIADITRTNPEADMAVTNLDRTNMRLCIALTNNKILHVQDL